MTDRSVAVAELVSSLPEGVVATVPAALEKYRQDWARDPDAGMPCAHGIPASVVRGAALKRVLRAGAAAPSR